MPLVCPVIERGSHSFGPMSQGFKIHSINTLQRDENLERRSILQTLKLPSNPKSSIEPEKRVREISFVFETTE